ncbi:MAG TPA: hypothetical protein VK654_07555 [Nitrospirota bacterium]|nr:hypothetical protein [Nitrospirota bacterium]
MFTQSGGQTVAGGTYWDITTGYRVDLDKEGVLPGDSSTKYLKASSGAILVAGPILGLVYIIAMPVTGVAAFLGLLLQRIAASALGLGRHIIYFDWRPAESYLGGKNKKKGNAGDANGKPDTR